MKFLFFILASLALHFLIYEMLHPEEIAPRNAELAVDIMNPPTAAHRAQIRPPSVLQKSPPQKSVTAAAEPISAPAEPGELTEAPRLLKEHKIPYPESARRSGIEGVVEMRLVINSLGAVQSAELVRGPGYGLDEAALKAIRQFTFSPARIKNQSVPVKITYKYRFVLGD